MNLPRCHLCNHNNLHEHKIYRSLKRVTSDCKPWDTAGRLYTCKTCGCTQALCDEAWQEAIQSIYQNYTIYYQGQGEEQRTFDFITGRTLPRSEWLLECIKNHVRLPAQGLALDFGCGNGCFLKAFGSAYPQWNLWGAEFNEKYRAEVEALSGITHFHMGPVTQLPTGFDFVSLIHVLEHIQNPISFLKEIRSKLSLDGLIFIELPSYESNPFELLIVDHATHFSLETAKRILNQAGYTVHISSNKWISKEISLLGYIKHTNTLMRDLYSPSFEHAEAALFWIRKVVREARRVRKKSDFFGIFGTAIAATWLAVELSETPPNFFVEEDPSRVKNKYMGAPVYMPNEIPDGSIVFVAQPAFIAAQIVARLKRKTITYHYTQS